MIINWIKTFDKYIGEDANIYNFPEQLQDGNILY
jgi:hypothetical protein